VSFDKFVKIIRVLSGFFGFDAMGRAIYLLAWVGNQHMSNLNPRAEPTPADLKRAAAEYARATSPTDRDMGWRRDDIEIAFRAGTEWKVRQDD
jgi:hypothetical protein